MRKLDIKTNYDKFIKRFEFDQSKVKIENSRNEHQYYEILEELLDTTKKCVQCLTKEETEIVRNYIGVYKTKTTIADISKELNIPIGSLCTLMNDIALTLRNRINRGYAHLKEAYQNGEITKEELLNIELLIIDCPSEAERTIYTLISKGKLKTIGDITKMSISEIQNVKNVGKIGLNSLVDYIHSLGLIFKDEQELLDNKVKEELSDESIIARIRIETKLKELEKTEEKCDRIIQEQLSKKQKIGELRKELFKLINKLPEVHNIYKEQDKKQNIESTIDHVALTPIRMDQYAMLREAIEKNLNVEKIETPIKMPIEIPTEEPTEKHL